MSSEVEPPVLSGKASSGRIDALCMEPVKAWWTGSSKFGKRLNYTLPLAEGEAVDLFDTGHLPGPPRLMHLQLFRVNPQGGANGPINADFRARITWGSGGASRDVLVDWGPLGTAFAVECNTLRVSAVSYALETFSLGGAVVPYNPLTLAGPQAKYQLGGTVGIEGSPPPLPPTFTTDCRAVTAVDTQQSYLVPQFARRAIPCFGTDVVAPAVPTDYLIAVVGDTQVLQKYEVTADMLQSGIPLHNGARAVNLLKDGVVPDARTSIIFQLGM